MQALPCPLIVTLVLVLVLELVLVLVVEPVVTLALVLARSRVLMMVPHFPTAPSPSSVSSRRVSEMVATC